MGDVVKLPSAAHRKVRQPRHTKATRELRSSLPKFPNRWIFPSIREKARAIRPILELDAGAERRLLFAIFRSLDAETRHKVASVLEQALARDVRDRDDVEQALAFVTYELTPQTYGEQADVIAALRYIDEGRL